MKIIDKTPAELACLVGACPSIFELENGTFVIVGKILEKNIDSKIMNKIGVGETCIEVPRELITKLKL